MEARKLASEVLAHLRVRPVGRSEQTRYREHLARHHNLGDLAKIGETPWYVATWQDQWVAQLSVSAAALKCAVRDRWIGWDFRSPYGRLKLIANNSGFLILPQWHWPNVGSRVLSLLERRIGADWQVRFGHRLLLETFVEPRRFDGGVYRAANWTELGLTQGYRRTNGGYSEEANARKRVFVRPLCRQARARLTDPDRERLQLTGAPKTMLNSEQMRSLPQCFATIAGPRRPQKRHNIVCPWSWRSPPARSCAACAATKPFPSGRRTGERARERFGCRRENAVHLVPSESVIRDCLVQIESGALDRALAAWNRRGAHATARCPSMARQ